LTALPNNVAIIIDKKSLIQKSRTDQAKPAKAAGHLGPG
jgi:hypothetical protein